MTLQRSRLTSIVRALTGVDLSSAGAWWAGAERDDPDDTGPSANRRLTALTGALLLPLAAIVLLTGLLFGQFWRVHYFVGYVLLPVVLLKIGSTKHVSISSACRRGRERS